jgi:hypothetical protein
MLLQKLLNARLDESMGEQAVVDWFVTEVLATYRKAISIAKSTYDTTGSIKLAKMHGGGAIGKWTSANWIANPRFSVTGVCSSLGVKNATPEILGTRWQREEAEFSWSAVLRDVIEAITPTLIKKGYQAQARRLQTGYEIYRHEISLIGKEPEQQQPVAPAPPKEDPNKQAHAMINHAISSLPKDLQAPAREYVSRRGFTLAKLKEFLATRGIQM